VKSLIEIKIPDSYSSTIEPTFIFAQLANIHHQILQDLVNVLNYEIINIPEKIRENIKSLACLHKDILDYITIANMNPSLLLPYLLDKLSVLNILFVRFRKNFLKDRRLWSNNDIDKLIKGYKTHPFKYGAFLNTIPEHKDKKQIIKKAKDIAITANEINSTVLANNMLDQCDIDVPWKVKQIILFGKLSSNRETNCSFILFSDALFQVKQKQLVCEYSIADISIQNISEGVIGLRDQQWQIDDANCRDFWKHSLEQVKSIELSNLLLGGNTETILKKFKNNKSLIKEGDILAHFEKKEEAKNRYETALKDKLSYPEYIVRYKLAKMEEPFQKLEHCTEAKQSISDKKEHEVDIKVIIKIQSMINEESRKLKKILQKVKN